MNNEPRTKKDECVWYYFTRTINVAKSNNNNNPAILVEKMYTERVHRTNIHTDTRTHGHTDTHMFKNIH